VQAGAEVVVATGAEAHPSGPTDDATFEAITARILDQLDQQGPFDAVLLDLHGAMVTQSLDDAEGTLLRRLRERHPTMPVGVALDMHANIYDDIIDHATVVTGYHTYPHVDVYDAGVRAAKVIVATLRGEIQPVMCWGNVPMLPHVMRQGTHEEPNRSLQRQCIDLEKDGTVLAASVFVGFPHADIFNAGLSVVVCTNGDLAGAQKVRDTLLQKAWDSRQAFVFTSEPLADSVARAKAIPDGPVVLLDHCDNTASGGTMDTTVVLAEVLRQDLSNAVFFAIFDPEAVQQALAAGIGAHITLAVGGKTAMPALKEQGAPLTISGKVKLAFDGTFRNRGPMYGGVQSTMGPTVVIDTGKIEIVLVSRHQEPYDLNCLSSVGVDPQQKHFIVLKSRVHWRAGFGDLARHVVECDGLGVTTSNYDQLVFEHVRRPVFPLDPVDWTL
jgi:microcystin degradation protein MlrC